MKKVWFTLNKDICLDCATDMKVSKCNIFLSLQGKIGTENWQHDKGKLSQSYENKTQKTGIRVLYTLEPKHVSSCLFARYLTSSKGADMGFVYTCSFIVCLGIFKATGVWNTEVSNSIEHQLGLYWSLLPNMEIIVP